VAKQVAKLRRIRREQGFPGRNQLGDAIGVTGICVHYWETKRYKPRHAGKFQHAQRLEAILQTPIDVLLEPDTKKAARAEALAAMGSQTQKAPQNTRPSVTESKTL
jgi:hypothetical protein